MLTAIIVAAGSSQRMGFDKLFGTIAGKSVIAHTLHAFERASSVNEIIVAAREDRHDEIRKISRDCCVFSSTGSHPLMVKRQKSCAG